MSYYHSVPVKKTLKRAAILVAGWAFIVLGIAGLFLPVLQGILFLLIGLFILLVEYPWAHRLLHRLKARFPKIAAQFEIAKEKSERWIARLVRRDRPTATVEQSHNTAKSGSE